MYNNESSLPADSESQRDAILEAAMACFNESGYERTTLEDIAERAGLPLEVVSSHFPARADVMQGLYTLWSERLSAWIVYA